MRDLSELSERGFGDILDFINAGVYITDADRRIVFWNKVAEQIMGYSAAEVVGSFCRDDIMAHEDQDGRRLCSTDLCPLYRAMVRATPSEQPVVVYARSRSGERIPLSTSIAPILDDDGTVIGGIEVFRDERQSLLEMELARTVQRVIGSDIEPQVVGKGRAGDIRHCTADTARARDLGFEASVGLEDGLGGLVDWLRDRPAEDQLTSAIGELDARHLVF